LLQIDNELKWYLTELYDYIEEKDHDNFFKLSGLNNFSSENKKQQNTNFEIIHCNNAQIESPIKQNPVWAKKLYKKAVRRCHPDTVVIKDKEYKQVMIDIYNCLIEAYENNYLTDLMIESYRVFVIPTKITHDQLDMLKSEIKDLEEQMDRIKKSSKYLWIEYSQQERELFVSNFLKQNGVSIKDKKVIKDLIEKRAKGRKVGSRPENILRKRVKTKKTC
jgi:hypothetical protein